MPKTFAAQDADEFAELFESSGPSQRKHLRPGDKVRGRVVFIGEKTATVQLEDGQEGLLDLAGLRGKDGQLLLRVGDQTGAFVLRIRDRVIELAMGIAKSAVNLDVLVEAAQTRVPVEGTVTAANKGGYTVDVGGGAQAFCPHAHIDLRRVEDPATMVGQKLRFVVLEVRDGKDVLVSRRAFLEQDQQRRAEETKQQLVVGARLRGTVKQVLDFGAFVDLGGIEGLVPASELAYGKVKVQDVVQTGQEVEVEVLRVEPSVDNRGRPSLRIGLSMRALTADPFDTLQAVLRPQLVVAGTVRRVEAFGAFVELVPGVEGLIHVSAFGRRVGRPADVVQPLQKVHVRILAVDAAQRRISLAWVAPDQLDKILDPSAPPVAAVGGLQVVGTAVALEDRGAAEGLQRAPSHAASATARVPAIGELLDVTVDKHESFGIFVTWGTPPALGRGLVPVSELGASGDPRRTLPVGTVFRAVVLDARADGRVRLSRTAAQHAEEQAEAHAWLAGQQPALRPGMGTLGELLQASLGAKKGQK